MSLDQRVRERPNDKKIAYVHSDGTDSEIYKIDATRGRPSQSPTTVGRTSILPGEVARSDSSSH